MFSRVHTYIYVYKAAIKDTFAFKFDFILMSSVAVIQLAMQYYFLIHIFRSVEGIGDFTFKTTVTYLVLNCSVSGIFTYNVDMHLRYDIQYGKIITLLTKPISIPQYYVCKGLGIISAKILTESFLLFFISFLFFHPLYVPSFFHALCFLVSFMLGIVLFMQIALFSGFMTFFIEDNTALVRLLFFLRAIFSGALFPLDFFPLWLQKTATVLPFRLMINSPFKIFLGFIKPYDMVYIFAAQLFWIGFFYIIMKMVYMAGVKRYHSVGG